MLTDILATVREELGLPYAAGLTADLHSLLVYEPDQFFLAHQDSEKSDNMVATMVVTLPSGYTSLGFPDPRRVTPTTSATSDTVDSRHPC